MEDRTAAGAECPAPRNRAIESPRTQELKKGLIGSGIGDRVTYIENSPEKSVVLSPRLEELIVNVAGCQTEQVAALVRRIMYELLTR